MTATGRLIQLASEIAWRQAEFARLKQAVRADGPGAERGVTVYSVRSTTVKRHVRRGFTAVRVTRRAGK